MVYLNYSVKNISSIRAVQNAYVTFTLSMGYMKQCSRMPEAAPATMCVPTVLDAGRLS